MQNIQLTKGNILYALSALAFPIMATSFMQMAYNLTDMFWIGKLGSNAVASVGAAGMYMWFSNGLISIARMGGQVKSAHALGANNKEEAGTYASSSILIAIIMAIGFAIVVLLGSKYFIDFFNFDSIKVAKDAQNYLLITCTLLIFSYLNQVFSSLFAACGNSSSAFIANGIGLIMNIILDPLFIFGFAFIPSMNVVGASIATVFSQAFVTLIFLIMIQKEKELFPYVSIKKGFCFPKIKEILKIGAPVGLQSMLFSSISMMVSRLVSGFGALAIAVQKLGSQIESISWMSGDGFAAALNSFTAQNVGAKQKERVQSGFKIALGIMLVWGIFTSLLLFFGSETLFKIFLSEKEAILLGIDYLQILALSQLFMCLEITVTGFLNGMGVTLPSAIVSITFNLMRIPLAIFLIPYYGLNGIWWAITISSIFKGIIIYLYYFVNKKKLLEKI